MRKCAAIVFSGPSNNIIVDSNKSKIITNGGELTDLDYLLVMQTAQLWSREPLSRAVI